MCELHKFRRHDDRIVLQDPDKLKRRAKFNKTVLIKIIIRLQKGYLMSKKCNQIKTIENNCGLATKSMAENYKAA